MPYKNRGRSLTDGLKKVPPKRGQRLLRTALCGEAVRTQKSFRA